MNRFTNNPVAIFIAIASAITLLKQCHSDRKNADIHESIRNELHLDVPAREMRPGGFQ